MILLSGLLWTFIAVATDTAFYRPEANDSYRALFKHISTNPIITPLNNVLYNTRTENLAEHGLHPHYQHLLANLPQLLGPALIVLLSQCYPFTQRTIKSVLINPRLSAATTSILILSIIPHQESRFLLPCVPLLLTCLKLPTSPRLRTLFWSTWITFNVILSVVMGVYHQGGVIPAQLAIPQLITSNLNSTTSAHAEIFWWKTYPAPSYLLGSAISHPQTNATISISSRALQGMSQPSLLSTLSDVVQSCDPSLIDRLKLNAVHEEVFLAAPLAAWRLPSDRYPSIHDFTFQIEADEKTTLQMKSLGMWRQHLNLDDMDFGDDGIWPTLSRVVGRRGLGVWKVERVCS